MAGLRSRQQIAEKREFYNAYVMANYAHDVHARNAQENSYFKAPSLGILSESW